MFENEFCIVLNRRTQCAPGARLRRFRLTAAHNGRGKSLPLQPPPCFVHADAGKGENDDESKSDDVQKQPCDE